MKAWQSYILLFFHYYESDPFSILYCYRTNSTAAVNNNNNGKNPPEIYKYKFPTIYNMYTHTQK